MTTIGYDQPVKDLIAQLSATGHVTHSSYRKTSVTLHHNGGRLTHEGVLDVWRTRPASAHFDVDLAGKVAQFVKVDEYAWAVGNKAGNETTISIEMSNETTAPGWVVSHTTLDSATRLAGWLFAHQIHARPSTSNFFMHKHWSATDCAGPYVSAHFAELLTATQRAYDSFVKPVPKPPVKKTLAQVAKEVIEGKWGNGDNRIARLKAAGWDPKAVQAEVNRQLR